ncbi:MAG: hypothetical protein UY41_C0022G0008 [Candidatus Moranbacteria bacterium GW2011_GWE1_49_15]|nr:MAG: hypothetical protein UX75_C0041G0004 [Candidatus Moranbacteria bacterium GW2011_GWE2_47_10]KKW06529.1 MAG: hypothetical protein UY41_C0022G0008 [Candidatus Moranbacteria bacterium GW2011_GWE1_49_15]HBP01021.1 hypothetical protein [Candidatus Moranbacteria bacterium]
MSSKDTKYIVIPKGSFTYQSLGEFLNTFYGTDGQEAGFKWGNVQKNGFFIPHAVITKIKKMFPDWKERFEFYSQEGDGKIRKYSIPTKKKSAKAKQAVQDLKRITKSKDKLK